MKKEIHPEYVEATVHCSCGETFKTRSTKSEVRIEICSKCHPFYSGKQKLVDTGGRVERFQKKYGKHLEEEERRREEAETAAEAEAAESVEAAEVTEAVEVAEAEAAEAPAEGESEEKTEDQ